MPKAQRRAALKSALLGRFRDGEVIVLKDLSLESPKTAVMAKFFKAVKADKGALVVMPHADETIWRSLRNLPKTDLQTVTDINPYSVLRRPRVVFTERALQLLPEWIKSQTIVE